MEDDNMTEKDTKKTMNEYKKELQKFFDGNSNKTFDELTNKTLKKLLDQVKITAEKIQKESKDNSKKKQ